MPPSPLDLPILISQLPFVQKIAHVEQAKSEERMNSFAPLVDQKVRENKEQVQEVEHSDRVEATDRDGGQRRQPEGQMRERNPASKEEQEPMTSNASPWTGNIINVKI